MFMFYSCSCCTNRKTDMVMDMGTEIDMGIQRLWCQMSDIWYPTLCWTKSSSGGVNIRLDLIVSTECQPMDKDWHSIDNQPSFPTYIVKKTAKPNIKYHWPLVLKPCNWLCILLTWAAGPQSEAGRYQAPGQIHRPRRDRNSRIPA
jgi:hypothetical protein